MNRDALDQLTGSINLERPHQQNAVRWGLARLWRSADSRSLRGKRRGGKLQVPNGLYLVNHLLLYADKRVRAKPLGYPPL